MMQIYEQRIRQLELENVRNACRMDSIENLVKIENLTTQLNISKNNAQTHGTSSQNSLNSATLPTFQTRNNGIPIVVNHPNVRNVGNDNSPQNFNQASTNSGHPSNIINENVQPAKLNTTHATSNDSLPTDNSKQPLTGNSDSMQSEQQATFCPTNQSFLVNAPTLTKPPWMNYSHCQIKPMQTQQQHVAPVIYRHPQTVHQNQMMVANPHFPQKIMRQIPTNFVNLSWYPTTSRVSRSSKPYLTLLEKMSDILILQEHWLYNFEKDEMEHFLNKYKCHVKCVDDTNPISPLQRPRGMSGTAICYKREISSSVTEKSDGSMRINVIKVDVKPKPLLIIGVYMPCRGGIDADRDYREITDELSENYFEI
ncbi:Hypothetical predicted protein [Mytilus galloprovincialis]|uniref:Uncharacterized protein n=1 Tax=Mytilus galloprovincialis TaxID=29158 RepID=A0A8B6FNM9_MYTGA|nr:Hypothetical predicted protein [Mytilus galloprovincialis]